MARRSAIPGVTESRGLALWHGKVCLQAGVGIGQFTPLLLPKYT